MRKTNGWAWAFAPLWLLVILAVLMSCLRATINNRAYFLRTYERLDIEARIGISPAHSADAIMAMINYMEGRRPDIQIQAEENGVVVDMFNEQEILHMVDVRSLYQAFVHLQLAGLLTLGILLALLAAKARKKDAFLYAALGGWWRALGMFACLLLVLGAYALVDFYDFWTRFHHVFFTNELWLMDYDTCRMIRICPLELFSGIIGRITAIALSALAALSAGAALLGRAGEEGGA